MRHPTLITLAVVGALAVAACGGDDDSATPASTTPATTSTTPATTAPVETSAAIGTTAASVEALEPDAAAAALAWTTVFDSTLDFEAKAPYLADAEALRPTLDEYAAIGVQMGDITLEPTGVAVTGDTAAITYKILFAGQSPYPEQDGTIDRVAGNWVVSRDQFCAFMATARTPCSS